MTQPELMKMADRLSVLYAVLFVGIIAVATIAADGFAYSDSTVVGGDFLAFYTAGQFALSGEALSAYDFALFDARLQETSGLELLGMMWQYPPTVFFLTASLALASYKISYFLWLLTGWSTLAFALRSSAYTAPRCVCFCARLSVSPLSYMDNSISSHRAY